MRLVDWIGQTRRSRGFAMGVALMVFVTMGGFAWAGVKGAFEGEGDKFDAATTRYVTLEPGQGPQTVQLLDVDGVVLGAECEAGEVSDAGYPSGIGIGNGIFFTNNSDRPVLINWLSSFTPGEPEQGYMNLEPGQGDPVFGVGQFVNEEHPWGYRGEIWTFAIQGYGGTSVTGILSMSARVNAGDTNVTGDETGECVFSVQARG